MNLTVKDIVKICNGDLFCGDASTICKTYNKDTRVIEKGDTYIGIKGQNFDGNSLYQEAFLKGANACILDKDSFIKDELFNYDKPIILVDNTISALKDIATYIRLKSSAIFIGVTGSVGKTSTKDIIYSVVSKKYKSLKTEGNYNNNIGLPLTIMRLNDEKCAVIEMGMNNLGEIDYLSKITKPSIAIITNVGTAHIGNLGSRENILKAKLEIKNGLTDDGILIINNDNDLLHDFYLKQPENILTVGINNQSDIMAKNIELVDSSIKFDVIYQENIYNVSCPVPSISFVYNSLVAFAVGILTNIEPNEILSGIKDFKLTKNRLEIFDIKSNIHIINDSYNASLDSMKSSIDLLTLSNGKRKIAVLGSMLELGDFSKKLHSELGKYVGSKNIDILITVGSEARGIAESAKDKIISTYSFDNNADAINKLKEILKEGDTVLVKASNSLNFIEIVNALREY